MLKYILIAIFSALLSGMGIGGGTLFVMLSTLLLGLDQKTAQAVNLIMFLSAGISSAIFNFKNKVIEKKLLKQILPLVIIGSFAGTIIVKNIQNENLRLYFSMFMALLGAYEIISSVINIKKAKNIKKRKEC